MNSRHFILSTALVTLAIIVWPLLTLGQDDSLNTPDVRIDVNKEYDEFGNLTQFDSSITSSWSGNAIPQEVLLHLNSFFGADTSYAARQTQIGTGFPFTPPADLNNIFGSGFSPAFDEIDDSILEMDSIFFQLNPNAVSPFSEDFEKYFNQQMKSQQQMMELIFGAPTAPLTTPADSTEDSKAGKKI